MKNALKTVKSDQSGVALIIAIILVLVMTTIATSISFISNNNFLSMSNYKSAQEAFFATESCVIEVRNILENTNPAIFYELVRSGIDADLLTEELGRDVFVLKPVSNIDKPPGTQEFGDPDTWQGPVCRTGSRALNSNEIKQPENFLITNETKSSRHVKNFSIGEFDVTPISIIVTGKSSLDQDKADRKEENSDRDDDINTGIEIISGFEVITLGGGGNKYE